MIGGRDMECMGYLEWKMAREFDFAEKVSLMKNIMPGNIMMAYSWEDSALREKVGKTIFRSYLRAELADGCNADHAFVKSRTVC